MKLSEIKGEKALDMWVDLIDPISAIISDKEVEKAYKSGQKLQAIKTAIKSHKKEVVTILAIIDGEDPETYEPSAIAIPVKLAEIFNDPAVSDLFISQEQMMDVTSFGPATENIGVNEI
jgi:hypothetical protein